MHVTPHINYTFLNYPVSGSDDIGSFAVLIITGAS